MQIILNGQKKDIPAGLTVKGLLEHLDIKPERVAVEINGSPGDMRGRGDKAKKKKQMADHE
jgi:sulfur carrier protein ThiS